MSFVLPQNVGCELLQKIVGSLVAADWENPKGPLVLNGDLQLVDLANADFLINTRLFLAALEEQGGAPLTETGNLNRKFVALMFDRMKLPKHCRETTVSVCKVINEQDVWILHIVRVVSECAGLIARRGKRFQLTKLGLCCLRSKLGAVSKAFSDVFSQV